jgi:glycosyltransferase involved in cell wall biosynthesis
MIASVMPQSGQRVRMTTIVLHKFDRGGSPRVAAYLAKGFAELGMRVELVVFTDQGEVDEVIAPLAGSEVKLTYLGAGNGPRALDLAVGLPRLAGHLRRTAPDVVIAAANNVALVTAAAVRRAGLNSARLFLKTTNPIASSRHHGILKAIRRWSYGWAFSRSAGVWTLSPSESEEMRAAFPRFSALFRAVYNPYVTSEMFGDEPRWNAAESDRPTILSVGRLTRQKRLERLIGAFAQVSDKRSRLLILGEGEERKRLEALVRTLGLQDRVEMPGFRGKVAEAYRAANLFVLTSDYEGLPAVLLEAMASNCPILTTNSFPAARTIVDGADCCAIIDDSTPAALAAQIDAQLRRPRPSTLRAIATHYSIESGIRSHFDAMTEQSVGR